MTAKLSASNVIVCSISDAVSFLAYCQAADDLLLLKQGGQRHKSSFYFFGFHFAGFARDAVLACCEEISRAQVALFQKSASLHVRHIQRNYAWIRHVLSADDANYIVGAAGEGNCCKNQCGARLLSWRTRKWKRNNNKEQQQCRCACIYSWATYSRVARRAQAASSSGVFQMSKIGPESAACVVSSAGDFTSASA